MINTIISYCEHGDHRNDGAHIQTTFFCIIFIKAPGQHIISKTLHRHPSWKKIINSPSTLHSRSPHSLSWFQLLAAKQGAFIVKIPKLFICHGITVAAQQEASKWDAEHPILLPHRQLSKWSEKLRHIWKQKRTLKIIIPWLTGYTGHRDSSSTLQLFTQWWSTNMHCKPAG